MRDLGTGWRAYHPPEVDGIPWRWALLILLIVIAIILAGCIDDPGAIMRGWTL